MTSLEEYKKQLSELNNQHDSLENASSISEAKDNIIKLQEIEKILLFLEQRIHTSMEDIRSSKQKQSKSSFLSAFYRTEKQELARKAQEDIDHKLELYKFELILANSIRSITGQVTIPKLKSFIIQEKQKAQKSVNYYDYIKSAEWRKKAEEAKARSGNCCQVCNRSRADVQLDAHHRTYERLGNERPEDITVLCRECHQLYEDEKKEKKSLRQCKKCGSSFSPSHTSHRYCTTCFVMKKQKSTQPANENTQTLNNSKRGFCIRCQKKIKLHPQTPYCYSCFKIWKQFENNDYQEKTCHICGKENESTMSKPVCRTCYRKYRNTLEFS